jgi:hypothetical protein
VTEYYLANMGATCSEFCEDTLKLKCNPTMNMGSDNGVAIIQHLAKTQGNISTCLEGWLGNQWWAPDQPNFVADPKDANFNRWVVLFLGWLCCSAAWRWAMVVVVVVVVVIV